MSLRSDSSSRQSSRAERRAGCLGRAVGGRLTLFEEEGVQAREVGLPRLGRPRLRHRETVPRQPASLHPHLVHHVQQSRQLHRS